MLNTYQVSISKFSDAHSIIKFSAQQKDTKKTSPERVLALIVAPLMGETAFVARMIPIFSLKAGLLFGHVQLPSRTVHEWNGFDFMVTNGNLKCNQKMFSYSWELSVIIYIYSVKHRIDKNEYEESLLSYDIVHLYIFWIAGIRNQVTDRAFPWKFL